MKSLLRGFGSVLLVSLSLGLTNRCHDSSSSLPSQDVAAARAHIRASAERERAAKALEEARTTALPSRPQPPAVARTVVKEVEVRSFAQQVYLDSTRVLAHRKVCGAWNRQMVRIPLAAARMQGYTLHSACAPLADLPEIRKQVTLHPEWVEYERQLATYENAEAERKLAELSRGTKSIALADTYSPSASSSASGSGSTSGVVHVKGHYRKDGTYVRPHTRSKPKK